MNISEVLLAMLDSPYVYTGCVLLASIIILFINYLFLNRYLGGLILLQLSFIFNSSAILFGLSIGKLPWLRGVHYLIFELLTILFIYIVYSEIIKKQKLILQLWMSNKTILLSWLIVIFNILIILMFRWSIANDGSSRIEFMTAGWFSYVRPFMSILVPLSYFFSMYLLSRSRYGLTFLVLVFSVLSNIASGSKASFVFGIVSGFLILRDLGGSVTLIPRKMRVATLVVVVFFIGVSFNRLNLTWVDVGQRFVMTGDATIMVYFSEHPEEASRGLSILAKLHRGAARLLGDTSAKSNDTLFGFALNMVDTGENSYTGPNASIPAYMFSNYDGWMSIVGLISILGYLSIVKIFLNQVVLNKKIKAGFLFLPFVISSLTNFPQDYYVGMSDIVLMVSAMVALIVIKRTAFHGDHEWRQNPIQS
jgi:hypothetical protein